MFIMNIRSSIVLICAILPTCTSVTVHNTLYRVTDNKRNHGDLLSTARASSTIECQVVCANTEGCEVSNFGSSEDLQETCELFGAVSVDPDALETSDDWMFIRKLYMKVKAWISRIPQTVIRLIYMYI